MQAFSVAILIATIVTLSELNSAGEYEYSGGSRGAAGWMLFVAIASLIFHGTMICVRVLYAISVIKKNYSGYAFTVSGQCYTNTYVYLASYFVFYCYMYLTV